MDLLVLLAAMLAATLAAVMPWWFGRRRGDYSHRRQTISELGETGAPDARWSEDAWRWRVLESLTTTAKPSRGLPGAPPRSAAHWRAPGQVPG